MSRKLPTAVFWDWDGTIADSYHFLNDAHNHTLVSLGFQPFKGDEYREYFGKPREVLYPAIYKDKCEAAKDIFQAYVFENAHKVRIIDGCGEVLKFFHERGIVMGIVSNKKASFIQEELKHTPFAPYFSLVLGAGEAVADKPSAAPLLLALERCGIDGDISDVWFVGDTENDLVCAVEAGVKCIFFDDGTQVEGLADQYSPHFVFKHYMAFREFLVAI